MESDAISGLPYAALRDLAAWMQSSSLPAVVIGGVAVSLLSRPRVTRDMDIVALIDDSRLEELTAQAARFGFLPRITNAVEFARTSRILLLQHEPTGIQLDVSLGALPFEREMIARSQPAPLGDVCLPLPTPEDLIVTKAVAGRPRDIADIEAIVQAHPGLDRARVRNWVSAFADALDQPDMLATVEALLSSPR